MTDPVCHPSCLLSAFGTVDTVGTVATTRTYTKISVTQSAHSAQRTKGANPGPVDGNPMTANPNRRPFTDGSYATEAMADSLAKWYRKSRTVKASHVEVKPFGDGWWVIYHAEAPFIGWHDNPARLDLILSVESEETP